MSDCSIEVAEQRLQPIVGRRDLSVVLGTRFASCSADDVDDDRGVSGTERSFLARDFLLEGHQGWCR